MREHEPNGPHPMTRDVVANKGTLCSETDGFGGAIELYTPYTNGSAKWELQWTYNVVNANSHEYPIELVTQLNTITFEANEATWLTTKDSAGFRIRYGSDAAEFVTPEEDGL